MPAFSTVLLADVLRGVSATLFDGTLQPVGPPLAFPARIVRFLNQTTVNVAISWDGINDADVLTAGDSFELKVGAGNCTSTTFDVAIGTQFYVSGDPGTGNFYVAVYYAK